MENLQVTLEQISTGDRIAHAKNDPAGLIASELLRSDMTAMDQAIRNTTRADSVLKVADSAMGQLNTLLDRGLELAINSANTGAVSPDEIAANQVELNQILSSIDRIARTTKYMDKPLLDGSQSAANGGLTFQIGTDVVSSQQINVAIDSVATDSLGSSGKLYQLAAGESYDLKTNPGMAATVLQEAINQVSMQRGAIGAVQKSTLAPNKAVLEDTLVATTDAESQIRDTDIITAMSNLTRNQILLQNSFRISQILNQTTASISQCLLG
jgi:flagellin